MSFYNEYLKYKEFDFDGFFNNIKDEDITRIINKRKLDEYDFLTLLSPTAEKYLEEIANRANESTLQNFGKAILLFTPLYLANYCVNRCAYCGFNFENKIKRKKLTMEEIEKEARAIRETGIRHILILTGSSRKETPVSYMIDAVKILRDYFDSISVEVYALEEEEYKQLVEVGVDGMSMYQEVYNEQIYDKVHISGPKKKYRFRLDAPERACKAKIRNVCLGPLLGLDEWRKEFFYGVLHAKYLRNKYSDVEVAVALPRIRSHAGSFTDIHEVNDKNIVQMIIACRLFLPRCGITMTTREKAEFKDNLIPLGVNKISAGVCTEVGGHDIKGDSDPQFDIIDPRSVDKVKEDLLKIGYQPVFKDWMNF
ncbi:2-iminoacetate synthase ThiH [Clostridium brassicae]|uniref:2-iminoacetate synthase ThiH n=1 Tax=Clostridium brassicae TaxID=2999072 RepID=A0ABT4D9J8_9CLOT|nr:2-iminoacetate synthase ThiH [Clostridium brassicae]MCY6958987.1 2-iminoacetate synthase ThiH [Clostridium brassicae]